MCLTLPYRVISKKGEKFVIMYNNRQKIVTSPLVKISKGDYVLVQNNIVVQKINKQDAKELLQLIN